jgi:hypothetical protein
MFLLKLNEVLASRRSFVSDRMNSLGLGIALLINIIHWLILYIKIKPGNSDILLHYNVVYGADFIGDSIYLYWIPLLALIMLLTNLVAAIYFYKKEKLAAYFISISSVAVQIVFLVASLILIIVND